MKRQPPKGIIKLARGTPPQVAAWLRSINKPGLFVAPPDPVGSRPSEPQPAVIETRPDHPVAIALLTDERMEVLWELIADWPGALNLIQVATHYANPFLLSKLVLQPNGRKSFGYSDNFLAASAENLAEAAENFLDGLKLFRSVALERWREDLVELIEALHAFSDEALKSAEKNRAFYDFARAQSRRGKGSALQRQFREVIMSLLPRLIEQHGGKLSKARQNEATTILGNVVFPEFEIDAETERRRRERQASKTDNSG